MSEHWKHRYERFKKPLFSVDEIGCFIIGLEILFLIWFVYNFPCG